MGNFELVLIGLFFAAVLLNAGLIISIFIFKKSNMAAQNRRTYLILCIALFKMILVFVWGLAYLTNSEMETSARIFGGVLLIFHTAFCLGVGRAVFKVYSTMWLKTEGVIK